MYPAEAIEQLTDAKPVWQQVPKIAELVRVFEPDIQVCTWQRTLDPIIGSYLASLDQSSERQTVELLTEKNPPKLDLLPQGPGRQELVDDLGFLAQVLFDLLGCTEIGMRFAQVHHAMCPGWHFDRVGMRLICTYQGPGTQWLSDQDVDRSSLSQIQSREFDFRESAPGEIVLLKGALWQGNESFGAIHRSPDLPTDINLRTLVTLDPLWDA